MTLTIVGLGPGSPELLTLEAKTALERADKVIARAVNHPALSIVAPANRQTFDTPFPEPPASPESLEALLSELLRHAAGPTDTVYAVPGHPLFGDALVQLLLQAASDRGIAVRVVSGLSIIEPVTALLGINGLPDGIQLVDALACEVEPRRPAIISQISTTEIMSSLQPKLIERYPEDFIVTVVHAPGTSEASIQNVAISTLDRIGRLDANTCIYVPSLPANEDVRTFNGLQAIVAQLRHPETGCPWDRKQTHESLKGGLLQEAYEVLAALDDGDPTMLQEELGDLLLHVLMQSQIAAESEEFSLRDVISGLSSKLVRRHPHVFGTETVADADEVVANWDAIKRAERGGDQPTLGSVTPNQPALAYAQELVRRAARAGFDWPTEEQALDKLAEEVREIADAPTDSRRIEEFGDTLLALVNVARGLNIDAEEALRLASRKFYRRFSTMEALVRARQRSLSDMDIGQLQAPWQEAKRSDS